MAGVKCAVRAERRIPAPAFSSPSPVCLEQIFSSLYEDARHAACIFAFGVSPHRSERYRAAFFPRRLRSRVASDTFRCNER